MQLLRYRFCHSIDRWIILTQAIQAIYPTNLNRTNKQPTANSQQQPNPKLAHGLGGGRGCGWEYAVRWGRLPQGHGHIRAVLLLTLMLMRVRCLLAWFALLLLCQRRSDFLATAQITHASPCSACQALCDLCVCVCVCRLSPKPGQQTGGFLVGGGGGEKGWMMMMHAAGCWLLLLMDVCRCRAPGRQAGNRG